MKEKKNNKTVKRNLKTKHLRMLVFSPYNYFIKEYNFKKNFTMFNPFFKNSITAVLISISFCNTVNAQITYNPLATALGFNVFTSKDLKAKAGDTQGPVAIGGNLLLDGQTVFAINTSGTYPTNSLNDGNNYGIVIDGKIIYTSGNSSNVNNGFLRLKDTSGSTIYYVDNNNAASNLRVTAGAYNSNPQVALQKQQPLGTATNASGIDFTTAFTQLISNSNKISTLSSGSCSSKINEIFIPSGSNPSITLAENKINIINLNATQLNNLTSLTFTNTPTATRIIVFNVSVSGAYDWSTIPNFAGINEQNSSFMLWNFYSATAIKLSGANTLYGTLLAPNADINKTSSNNANGQIAGKSFEMGSGEVHYYPFAGLLPDCPTGGAVLALSNIEFSAFITGQNVTINLNIAKEEIGDIYEIQRSSDGISFSTFKEVLKAIEQNGKYKIYDNVSAINAKKIYYRAKVISSNRTVYSSIKFVKLFEEGSISIWPVPVNDFINISFQSITNTKGTLQILDTKGTILFNKNYTFLKGNNSFVLNNLSGLTMGNYILKIISAEEKSASKQFTKL